VKTLRDLIGAMMLQGSSGAGVSSSTCPSFIGSIIGRVLDFLQIISMRLFTNSILTARSGAELRRDNVVSDSARGFAELGIEPTPMEAVMPRLPVALPPLGPVRGDP
jgi:hypothetical protein